MRIQDKAQMYRLLQAGAFGNTIEQWFDVDQWEREAPLHSPRGAFWGVRTLQPGGPCRLYCPREEVRATTMLPHFQQAGINISMMIDACTRITLWGEVVDSDSGLLVYGIETPPQNKSWRDLMPTQGRHWEGVAAKLLLRKHLWPNSLDDLEILRDTYPGHVIEFSACEDAVGRLPTRNGVIWEVRAY